jgi:hypothetical protein
MGQKRSRQRVRVVPILVAGVVGYLLGGWDVTGLRNPGLSASQSVAMRFPDASADAQATTADRLAVPSSVLTAASRSAAPVAPDSSASGAFAAAPATASAMPPGGAVIGGAAMGNAAIGNARIADFGDAPLTLLDPEPMVSHQPTPQPAAPPSDSAPSSPSGAAAQSPPLLAVTPNARDTRPVPKAREFKPAAALIDRRLERPGYVLNDAQIASIKRRLDLTPDQERMWPAVEAALRNLSYPAATNVKIRGAAATPLVAADPNSSEVQDLKSAAIPLIMSFNPQQKDEVRNLVHVMGLDQLASQF